MSTKKLPAKKEPPVASFKPGDIVEHVAFPGQQGVVVSRDSASSYFVHWPEGIKCQVLGDTLKPAPATPKALAKKALESLLEWRPEHCLLDLVSEGDREYWQVTQEDWKAPFFSESMLYPLMGKDDARMLLSLIRRLSDAVDKVTE